MAMLLAGTAVLLVWMRRLANGRPAPRFLGTTIGPGAEPREAAARKEAVMTIAGARRRRRRGVDRDRRGAGCGRVGALRIPILADALAALDERPPTLHRPDPAPDVGVDGAAAAAAGCWRVLRRCCGCAAAARGGLRPTRLLDLTGSSGPDRHRGGLCGGRAGARGLPARRGCGAAGGGSGRVQPARRAGRVERLRPPCPGPGRGRPRSAASRPGGLPDPGQPAAPRRAGVATALAVPAGCSTTAGRCAGSPSARARRTRRADALGGAAPVRHRNRPRDSPTCPRSPPPPATTAAR